MPKILRNTYHGDKNLLYTELVERYNSELKETCEGRTRMTRTEIAEYLGCCPDVATRHMKGVRKIGNTRLYSTIDVARKFADDTIKQAGRR